MLHSICIHSHTKLIDNFNSSRRHCRLHIYIFNLKSFWWYSVVEKPNARCCFVFNQDKKKRLLCPQTIIKEHIYHENVNYLEQHCLVEAHLISDMKPKHVQLDQLYSQILFNLNTQNTIPLQNSKTNQSSPHIFLYQTIKDTKKKWHYQENGAIYV